MYSIGLRQTIDPSVKSDFSDSFLVARKKMRERLDEGQISDYVESFDAENINSNASVADERLASVLAQPVECLSCIDYTDLDEFPLELA